MASPIDDLRQQWLQLRALHADGALSDAAYEEARAALERRLIDAVVAAPGPVAAPAAAPTATPAAATGPAPVAPRRARPSRLAWGVALGVLLFGGVGYAGLGAPGLWAAGPAATSAAAPAPAGSDAAASGAAPHPTDQAQIQAMVERLAERLAREPGDAEGWVMLARSYAVMGRHTEARPAYEKAIALRPGDAALMADFADTLAMTQGGRLDGTPMKWVRDALKIEPDNLKARSLAATDALVRERYAEAIAHWERVVATAPADSAYLASARDGLAEARRRSGQPAPATPAAPAAAAGAAPAAVSATASVSGQISLAPALAAQVSPGDTVFILARSADPQQRMPLAVLRRQVADLPLRFTLDDSASMSPAARLSGVPRVVVSARISKSGQATPQPGDIGATPVEVAVGRQDLRLELNQPVR